MDEKAILTATVNEPRPPARLWERIKSGGALDFENFSEVRKLARRRLPKGIFEYIDRGTEDERGLAANREAFDRVKIKPFVLRSGSERSTTVSLFGRDYTAPIVVAPTACTGLVHYRGEIRLAQAAAKFGIPYTAATEAITSVEDIARESPAPIWFQLYLWDQAAISNELIERAWDSGVRTILMTVDTPVLPKREYNARNGFDIPFRLSARSTIDIALHPRWVTGVFGRHLLKHGLPTYENYPRRYRQTLMDRGSGPTLNLMPDLSWNHVRRVRERWKGALVLKGILRREDAIKAKEVGADGVVVSSHGGRNLDMAVSPIEVLAEIVDAVGPSFTVLADGSIQRGSDIFKLIALGAKAVLVGRSMLYGTAVGGEQGALKIMKILADELALTMDMAGCRTLSDVNRGMLFGGGN